MKNLTVTYDMVEIVAKDLSGAPFRSNSALQCKVTNKTEIRLKLINLSDFFKRSIKGDKRGEFCYIFFDFEDKTVHLMFPQKDLDIFTFS